MGIASTERVNSLVASTIHFLHEATSLMGDYQWYDKHGYSMISTSMKGILEKYGFAFNEYSDSKVKIPSIIIVNIVSPRVDYHGHDKSRIDTHI
jgi:hypothetical protein